MAWRCTRALRRIVRNEDGQDLLEYALLMLLISVALISGVTQLGEFVNATLWEPLTPLGF